MYSMSWRKNVRRLRRKNTEREKKEKLKQRKTEMKIIEHRAEYMEAFLKKNEKGEKWWVKWKDVELGEYIGEGNPQTTINKIRAHDFKLKSLYVLIKKDTSLNRLTVYDGLSNWCGCGEIDKGKEVFIHHVRRNHKGKVPKNSCISRPIWYD